MQVFVNWLVKIASTIPYVGEFMHDQQEILQFVINWIKENPSPTYKNQRWQDYREQAVQAFNLEQLTAIANGTLEVQDCWDSETETSNYKWHDGQKVDFYFDKKWITAELEKTLDELINIKYQSYQEAELKWVSPNKGFAPYEAMSKRFD